MGIKRNNPGCNCCAGDCQLECFDADDNAQFINLDTIQCDIDPDDSAFVDATSASFGPFYEITGMASLAGVYEMSLVYDPDTDTCSAPDPVEIDPTPAISVTQYSYGACSGGPFTTTSITITAVTYEPVVQLGSLAPDSIRLLGIRFLFFNSLGNPVTGMAFIDPSVPSPVCSGGDLRTSFTPVDNSAITCPAYFTPFSVQGSFLYI